MSGINPVQGLGSGSVYGTSGQGQAKPASDKVQNFGKSLVNSINKVDGQQQASAAAIQDLLAGRSKEILPVVAKVAEADTSFKLLLGVRNKVIEAYKQTMNMQV